MTARDYDVYLFWFRRKTLLGGRETLVYLSQATFPADESVTDGDLVFGAGPDVAQAWFFSFQKPTIGINPDASSFTDKVCGRYM